MLEIWKNIKGYEGVYQVSNLGNVRRINNYIEQNKGATRYKRLIEYKILKFNYDKQKYLLVHLCVNGVRKCKKVHRLVAEAFIENTNNKPYVNHKDGNKQNNNVDNLEWVTPSENNIHAYKLGLTNPVLNFKKIQYVK